LRYDSRLFRGLCGWAGLAAATGLRAVGRTDRAAQIEAALHRGAFSRLADRVVEARLRRELAGDRGVFKRYIDTLSPLPATKVFFEDPARLLGTRILVLKSPAGDEKGVIVVDYLFVFPLLARMFDIEEIARHYYLVLEPSWSGYCDYDLLSLLAYDFPIFVQGIEPRDLALLASVSDRFINVPVAGNWWVDHRTFRPLEGVARDADVLFIAAWGKYKRHDAFFASLARVRQRGRRLKTILVGYKGDMTLDDIWQLARKHGIADQLEIHENVSPPEVNRLLNRVKVNVLWSRREGFNRAIIEGFFAGTPGIMRQGFNYGYDYPYINEQTGCFATQRTLGEKLVHTVDHFERFSPRTWVMDNMTPQHATAVVDEHLADYARRSGKLWTRGELAVKVTSLNAMDYWNPPDRDRFAADYAVLQSLLR